MLFAQALGLERREETLYGGVVPAVPTATNAAYDAVGLKQTLEVESLGWSDALRITGC